MAIGSKVLNRKEKIIHGFRAGAGEKNPCQRDV